MKSRAWLTQDAIPLREVVAISLPNDQNWRSQFLGALLLLTGAENWELFGTLTPEEMAAEWLDIFLEFVRGETTMIPTGAILEFGGDELPDGFLWARGQDVSRETYSRLFEVYNTKYGIGDGSTTFGLPDRQQRVGAGYDPTASFFDALGKTGGQAEVILLTNHLPVHNHSQAAHTHIQNAHTHIQNAHNHTQSWFNQPGGAAPFWDGGGTSWKPAGNLAGVSSVVATNQNTTPTNQNAQPAIGDTGNDDPHPNLAPYITLNYIIKY